MAVLDPMTWAILLDVFAGAFFVTTAGFVSLRKPPEPLWPVLLWIQLLPLVWIAGDVGFHVARSAAGIDLALTLVYAGSLPLVATWCLMSIRFAETHGVRFRWATRSVMSIPFVWAGVTLLCAATNPWHGQFLTPTPGLRSHYHWLWWSTVPWGYLLMAVTVVVFANLLRRPALPENSRRQARTMLVASLVGPVANAIYTTFPTPLPIDLTMIAALIAGALFVVGIYRGRLFDMSPVALREILRRQPVGLLLVNTDGRLLWSNAQAATLLGSDGLPREEFVTALLADRVDPVSDRSDGPSRESIFRELASGRFSGGLFRLSESEERRWLWIESERAARRRHAPIQLIHIQDVTRLHEAELARSRMESHLRQSERLHSLGTLAAGMAHEVNNPLGVALLAAEVAKTTRDESPAGTERDRVTDEALETIISHCLRAARILKGMLRFSRHAGDERQPCDLRKIVQQAGQLSRAVLTRCSAKLDVRLGDDLPRVLANATELEQVLINLIDNAARSGSPGRTVRIRARAVGRRVEIEVSDDGDGMNPDAVEHVFEPFFTARSDGSGAGLGLSVVHGIVEDHGGQVRIDSSDGDGTRLIVELPAL